MSVACIGDLHGVDRWKEALSLGVDHFVFLGDYVDSFSIDNQAIVDNLKAVIAFKKSNPDSVTLLLGNHDIQYIYYPRFRCSGFRIDMLKELQSIFKRDLSLFKVAHQMGDKLFVHGGLTNYWVRHHLRVPPHNNSLADILNDMLQDSKALEELAIVGRCRGGRAKTGGPFWCDFNEELIHDPFPNINQIVGHTQTSSLVRKKVAGIELINVDYLAYSDEPIFVINIEK